MEKEVQPVGVLFADEPRAVIECLLFVANEPLDLGTLSEIAGITKSDARILLQQLEELYNGEGRGIRLVEVAGGFQLITRPEMAPYIEKLYKPHTAALSHAALETLAIVTYRQPITRAEIEQIRGVKVEGVLTTLMERKLIREVGRKEGPGRPILYGTTKEFLTYFGLKDLKELPDLATFQSNKDNAPEE
ncbi:hypothetical protein SY88_22330 [Clostridiales bacterium PH28_bin88]|nr:hypothetical protein SY88_22330 [Clostridiales bacterium PH28_bin88]